MSNEYNLNEFEELCSEQDLSQYSAKEIWYKKYQYCLYECVKCDEIHILKKILWELRKVK